MVKNLPPVWGSWVSSLGREDPLKKARAIHCILLPGKSCGQRSPEGYGLWGCKESDTTERLTLSHFHKGEC